LEKNPVLFGNLCSEIQNTPLNMRTKRHITVITTCQCEDAEVSDVVPRWWRVPGAEGADPPAEVCSERARYNLTFKNDSAVPDAVAAAAPGVPPPNAAAAAAADGGASAAKPGELAADDAATIMIRGCHETLDAQ
jgi:hypothetical protein